MERKGSGKRNKWPGLFVAHFRNAKLLKPGFFVTCNAFHLRLYGVISVTKCDNNAS